MIALRASLFGLCNFVFAKSMCVLILSSAMSSLRPMACPLDVTAAGTIEADDVMLSAAAAEAAAVTVFCSLGTIEMDSTRVSVLVSTLPCHKLCATVDGVGELDCDSSENSQTKKLS